MSNSIKVEFERKMATFFQQIKVIGGKLINIGRIIFAKSYQFLTENPNMALCTIIGAVPGMVPLIWGILSVVATFLGAAIGSYVDHLNKGGR